MVDSSKKKKRPRGRPKKQCGTRIETFQMDLNIFDAIH